MTLKIQNLAKDTTYLESTSAIEAGESIPRVIFTNDNFSKTPRPRWITNVASQREGNFKHYSGRDDAEVTLTLFLSGATRYENFKTLQDLKEPIYFDAEDIKDSSYAIYSGNYIILFSKPKDNVDLGTMEVPLRLIAYNNI